jgi:outer membrane protein assembly factor BamE (lipoprotein component of BamABCDE complex)
MDLTRRGALALLAVLALSITACDPQRVAQLEEGVSTEVEVRKQFGDPVTITTQADGSRILDYPRQPEGWTNYVITIGPDGKMSSLRQLLNADNLARVQPGLGMAEVRALLGRPARVKRYVLKNEEVWDWRFRQHGQESKLFNVTFGADGRVIGTAIGDDPREVANGGR